MIEEACVMASSSIFLSNSSIWEVIKSILEITDWMIKEIETSWMPTELEANSFNSSALKELQYLKHFLKERMSVWAIV